MIKAAQTTSINQQAIQIENLHKVYGKFRVLKGVNLTVPKGTIFGLLGPNGAGKSTLLKILVGSTRLSSGKVQVLGLDPSTLRNQLRSLIGYMPQVPALYEDLSAYENVAFFGAAHRMPDLKTQVDKVMDFVGLTSRQNDQVFGFSGGMKQRVSLACALVHQPKALFLDEPTAGVDPKLREIFWRHFRDLTELGVTIFITTHQMDEAFLCDQLAIMSDGVILLKDTPDNIVHRGHARILVEKEGIKREFSVIDYPTELPGVLKNYGLDPAVSSIEIVEDKLDKIMLELVSNKEPANENQDQLILK